jgi:hypothetical protein
MQKVLISPDVLLQLTRKKIDINELVDALDARHVFDEEDEAAALRDWKKAQIRRAVKGIKDDNDVPLIFSIVDLDDDGKTVRKYKQESLFNIEDYRQVIEQYRQRRLYHSRIEKFLLKRMTERFPDAPLFEKSGELAASF